MIASSAARSTWVTKSLTRFVLTTSASPPSAARLMIEPARRAARTAMFSIGCIRAAYSTVCAKDQDRSVPAEPSREYWLGGARDEDDGTRRPAAGRARALSGAGGGLDGDERRGCSQKSHPVRVTGRFDPGLRCRIRDVGAAAGVVAAGARRAQRRGKRDGA